MKPSYALALALTASLAAGSASAATASRYCINKDLINLGPTAHDIAVLFAGNQPIHSHYDGYPGPTPPRGVFSSFTGIPAGPNTFLHWRNLNGVDKPIGLGDLVHIGWCTNSFTPIIDMWWTDKSGGRVPGSVVCESAMHSSNGAGGVFAQWDNAFANAAMVVANVRFAVSRTPWPLEDLNRSNGVLAEQLRPLPGGDSLALEPGESARLAVPAARTGDFLVVSYDVRGKGCMADTQDFVQLQVQ